MALGAEGSKMTKNRTSFMDIPLKVCFKNVLFFQFTLIFVNKLEVVQKCVDSH